MDPTNLLTGMDFIRARVDNLTLLQAGMLIYNLRNPGVTQPELGQYFETTQATVCRIVTKLALPGGAGLPWIVLKPDASDPRRMVCFPSEEGRRLLKELRALKWRTKSAARGIACNQPRQRNDIIDQHLVRISRAVALR